ncbi:hypothetical protein ACFL35_15675 [Candidatus Riflebacteria bacterium]
MSNQEKTVKYKDMQSLIWSEMNAFHRVQSIGSLARFAAKGCKNLRDICGGMKWRGEEIIWVRQ